MAKGTTVRMRHRVVIILFALVIFCFSILIFRLINLQIFQGEFFERMASEQQMADTKISAQRGTIYDRNMQPLAQSATVWTVVLEPAYIDNDKKREIICNGMS